MDLKCRGRHADSGMELIIAKGYDLWGRVGEPFDEKGLEITFEMKGLKRAHECNLPGLAEPGRLG